MTVGAALQSAPRYPGSNQTKISALPIIQVHQGIFFADTVKGLGYDLQGPDHFYMEQTLGYDLGRDDRNSDWRDGSDRLKGIGTIKPTANTSLTLGYQITDWLATEVMMTAPLTDAQGVRYQANLKGGLWQNPSNTVSFEIDALFGNRTYLNTFYGISARQSRNSGFREYHAAAGMYAQTIYLDWTHHFSPNWSTDWNIGYTRLDDRITDSPLIYRHGGAESTLMVLYSF